MKAPASEADINSRLRELAEESRKLRQELTDMLQPPHPSPTRAFIHQQTWPKDRPAVVADRRRRRHRAPKKPMK
jgi:hypothetical protein